VCSICEANKLQFLAAHFLGVDHAGTPLALPLWMHMCGSVDVDRTPLRQQSSRNGRKAATAGSRHKGPFSLSLITSHRILSHFKQKPRNSEIKVVFVIKNVSESPGSGGSNR
jgi:hypothetical protein